MAKHLDLEEQEQLDELKHFWKNYGNAITTALLVVAAALVGWFGYQYWQNGKATQASLMYDEVERAVQSGDSARVERALADMNERFGSTVQAQQAGLIAARGFHDKGSIDAAISALTGVATRSSGDGYGAMARLRLAALLADKKDYDGALRQLAGSFPKDFAPLADDRRGDVMMLQGKKAEAKAEYEKAYKGLGERFEYRRLVETKLNGLGVDLSERRSTDAVSAAVKK
ncbi:MAG: tetratricopeptide repeat protein [Polaromonas sp.]|nr:tetratricopeptide repeat protein [Polaromonas sp.]